MGDADRIAGEVAERVRALIADAEQRAAEIVRGAEAEAERIRAAAEAEAHRRLDEVREALGALEGRLARAPAEEGPGLPPEVRPPIELEPEPPASPAPPEPPPAAAQTPESGTPAGDDAGARLVAMNMALEGSERDEIVARVAAGFEGVDAAAVTDEVLARTAK